MRRLAVPLLLVIALAGCPEVPQPFRHDGPALSLARPKMTRGITIRPVSDAPDGLDPAAAVVAALELHEVPATKSAGPAFGHVLDALPGGAGLQWVLTPPGAEPILVHTHPMPQDAAALRRWAAETANALSARLVDPDSRPPPGLKAPKRPSLKLVAFKGLPGDGDKAMTAATRRALERSGFPLAEDGADFLVECRVAVTKASPSEDAVAITWVVKGPDGKELAAIDQDGAVPQGRLSTQWGGLARDIAEGGVAGIIEVVAAKSRK